MAKLTRPKVIKAIPGSVGMVTIIARACKVTPAAIIYYLKQNADVRKLVNEEKEQTLDHVENRLYEMAIHGDEKNTSTFNSIKLILAKARGYSDKIEQKNTHEGEGFKLIIEQPENERNKVETIKKTKRSTKNTKRQKND